MGLAITILKLLLGAVFILAGLVKLTDSVNPDVHMEMKTKFVVYYNAVLAPLFGPNKSYTDLFRIAVGVVEALGGLLLLLPIVSISRLANLLLLINMLGAVLTHVLIKDPIGPFIAPVVLIGLLTTLYILSAPVVKSKRY